MFLTARTTWLETAKAAVLEGCISGPTTCHTGVESVWRHHSRMSPAVQSQCRDSAPRFTTVCFSLTLTVAVTLTITHQIRNHTLCDAVNVASTCFWSDPSSECVGLARYPNVSVVEHGQIAGAEAMKLPKPNPSSSPTANPNAMLVSCNAQSSNLLWLETTRSCSSGSWPPPSP